MGAKDAARLLICKEGKDNIARRYVAGSRPIPHGRNDHRIHIFHIDCASTPDKAIDDVTAKGIYTPVLGICRNYIQMPMDDQTWTGSVTT